MEQRFYQDMTAEEQGRWVSEFATIIEEHGERIALMSKGKEQMKTEDTDWVRGLFVLLGAWPFAQEFCEKAMRYGDFAARVGRFAIYIEKVKDALAEGLVMTDANGRRVAFVSPSTPLRRRGRPTKEEVAARLRGEALVLPDNSPENEKRRRIARMLGLEVVVAGDAPREKNNAELKAEREARAAEEARRNPSLFPDAHATGTVAGTTPTPSPEGKGGKGGGITVASPTPDPSHEGKGGKGGSATTTNGGGTTASGVQSVAMASQHTEPTSPCAQLMSDTYEMRMAQDKMHLNQLAWMLSPELAKRTEMVQSLRLTSESASERAKLLGDMGAKPEDVEPYSQRAKEATETCDAIYAAVDDELAILHKRLYLDLPFIEQFKAKYKGVNIENIQYITRPYYERVKKNERKNAKQMAKRGLPGIDERIRVIIERESPEYAARMKAEEEKKREVAELLRYLKRKDKPNVRARIITMEKRYARLIELLGEEEARVYRPIVDAAIADYEANHKKPDAGKPDAHATGTVAEAAGKAEAAAARPDAHATGTVAEAAGEAEAAAASPDAHAAGTVAEAAVEAEAAAASPDAHATGTVAEGAKQEKRKPRKQGSKKATKQENKK